VQEQFQGSFIQEQYQEGYQQEPVQRQQAEMDSSQHSRRQGHQAERPTAKQGIKELQQDQDQEHEEEEGEEAGEEEEEEEREEGEEGEEGVPSGAIGGGTETRGAPQAPPPEHSRAATGRAGEPGWRPPRPAAGRAPAGDVTPDTGYTHREPSTQVYSDSRYEHSSGGSHTGSSNGGRRGSAPVAILGRPFASVLERYEVGKEVGRGEGGVVRVCVDRSSGGRFACKSIRKDQLQVRVRVCPDGTVSHCDVHCSTVQYCTVLYCTMQYSAVQHGTVV